MLEKEKIEYDLNGFCVLSSFFTIAEIDEIIKHINKFITDEAPKLKGKDINYIDGEINSIHALDISDNYMKKLALSNRMTELARIFLDSDPELRKLELFAKPSLKGLASPIHQDNFYWCIDGANALTFWIALDDSSEENGGVIYYPGSHKLGLINHENSYAPGSSQKIPLDVLEESSKKEKPIIPLIKKGDILVHHSLTFHGSNANKSNRSRRGMTMQFKDATQKYNQKMLKHYKDNLEIQVAIRGK